MFEAISCSCCCTLHPHVPKLPLMARCPHHTQHQGELLACHVMTHFGARGGKRALIQHVGQRSLLSSLPGTAVLRHNLAKPWAMEPAVLLGWLVKHLLLHKGEVSLSEPSPALLGRSLSLGTAWWDRGCSCPGKGKTPHSRCVVRDRMA